MASDNRTSTGTAGSYPENEQKEAWSFPEQSPEPSPGIAAGESGTAYRGSAGRIAAGVAAIVSAGLGLASLTGTSLGDMLRSRQEIVGQIEAATGGGGDQVDMLYGAPWDTAALVNGVFALVAVCIGGVLLAVGARRTETQPGTPPWVKTVATGGVALGAIGLLVAGGMYLDLFAAQPEMPAMPGMGR